jgi:DegV family protein with EDD domain
MMNRVAVVADSVACLPKEQIERYGIHIMPIKIVVGEKVYRNGADLDAPQAYALLDKDPDRFSTSAPSPGEYLELFRDLTDRGASGILCLTLSSKLSTTFGSASVAGNLASEELPTPIVVLDTQTASASEGLIALAAARASSAGKDLTQVTEVARQVRDSVHMVVVLETIRHAYRTGRIPRIGARLGSMLAVKPIVTIIDGEARFSGLARSMEQRSAPGRSTWQ